MYYRVKFLQGIWMLLILTACEERIPTWSEDIAPVLYQNCVVCHRPGEAGPFPLLTYRDAAKRAKTIARMVQSRSMPPWPADPEYTHFLNERLLSDDEIELIQKWVAAGAPMGDSTQAPDMPVYETNVFLGRPDLILRHDAPFLIPGDNRDHFVAMKFPFELKQTQHIKAIAFVPGNRQLVHHMNGHLLSYDPEKRKDVFSGRTWVDEDETALAALVHHKLNILQDDGTYPAMTPSVVNYLPGVFFQKYPPGIGGYTFPKKGAIYVKNMHYGPSPIDTSDQSSIYIYFADKPPVRPVREMILGTLGVSPVEPPLIIPPETVKQFVSRYKVSEDISILTLNPHMHLTGKSFKGYALQPNGDTIRLISIPEWDFRWQYFYTFPKMVKIPKGSVLVAEAVFDNTSGNPNNPYDPPQVLMEKNGSMRTTDEMFQFIITWLPYQAGDEKIKLDSE